MATAVGLRSVFCKHWTGSLLELDSTRFHVNDDNQYFTESQDHNDQSGRGVPPDIAQVNWASRSKAFCGLTKLNPENARSLDIISVPNWSNTDSKSRHIAQNSIAPLSFEQLFGLSQLLKFIHGRSPSQTSNRHKKMNAECEDYYSERQPTVSNWKGVLSSSAMLHNQTSSLTNLPNSVCAHPNLPIDLPDPISLLLHRPKRRHYNSESELFLPECAQCNVNESERIIPKNEDDDDDYQILESNNCSSDQSESPTNSCPAMEDPCSSVPVNQTADEIEIQTSSLSNSQTCSVTHEFDQPDRVRQTSDHVDCDSGSSHHASEMVPNSIQLPEKQNDQGCTENDASSTETGKTSQVSLKIAKSVSFADEIGQCLAETYFFDDDEQQINVPEFDDLYEDPILEPCFKLKVVKSNNQHRFTRSRTKCTTMDPIFDNQTMQYQSFQQVSPTTESTSNQTINLDTQPLWNLTFPQPASQYCEFRHRLDSYSVSLESISLTQPGENENGKLLKMSGTIKVKNISFEKQVWLRVSKDNWKSHIDFPANYSPELSAGAWASPSRFDTFVFHCTLDLSGIPILNDQKIEFAIRYIAGCNGQLGEFWDSNNGRNYAIQLKMVRPIWRDTFIPSTETLKTTEYPSNQHHTLNPYTLDYRPNFDGFSSFTDYRAWRHFAGETSYY